MLSSSSTFLKLEFSWSRSSNFCSSLAALTCLTIASLAETVFNKNVWVQKKNLICVWMQLSFFAIFSRRASSPENQFFTFTRACCSCTVAYHSHFQSINFLLLPVQLIDRTVFFASFTWQTLVGCCVLQSHTHTHKLHSLSPALSFIYSCRICIFPPGETEAAS